ncbi:uncharacterized protein LOC120357197 [Solenopsis invicta]|uniref:uncharacterized protein LOC120357197 n=1 Tax=Solenopsis invicta TaxID=13686 RepID=UPI00193E860B|nr:uncharacterized protein LOC120357197 [Solenopsis invicta]
MVSASRSCAKLHNNHCATRRSTHDTCKEITRYHLQDNVTLPHQRVVHSKNLSRQRFIFKKAPSGVAVISITESLYRKVNFKTQHVLKSFLDRFFTICYCFFLVLCTRLLLSNSEFVADVQETFEKLNPYFS